MPDTSDRTAGRLALTLLLIALAGCRPSGPTSIRSSLAAPTIVDSAPPNEAPSSFKSVHEGSPITEEEARAFGGQIEAVVASGDIAAYGALFEWTAFGQIVADGLAAYAPEDKEFHASMLKAIAASGKTLPTTLMEPLAGSRYTFLRAAPLPNGWRVVFRMLSPAGELNYHEYYLARRAGAVRAVDLYTFNTGERLTNVGERIQRMLPRSSLGDRAVEKEAKQTAAQMLELSNAYKNGEFQTVLDLYNVLPSVAKHDKTAMLIRVTAAHRVGAAESLSAIDEYRRFFPNDPSVDLVSLSAFAIRKQWDGLHAAIDRIDQAVGGDPYLQVVHGEHFLAAGDEESALRCAEEALAKDPKQEQAYWLLVTMSLRHKDHARTASLLTTIENELGIELTDLAEEPDYSEFIKSPEYDAWVAARKQ